MARDVETVLPGTTVIAAANRFAAGDLKFSRHHALPIVDSAGRLQGIVTQGDLLRALQADPAGEMSVLDAGARSVVVTYSDERVFDAVTKMLDNNIGRLPVVDRKDATIDWWATSIARTVMGSWRGHVHEESVREHGWLKNLSSGSGHRGRGGAITGRVAAISGGEIRIALPADSGDASEDFVLAAPLRGVLPGDEVSRSDSRRTIAATRSR